MRQYEKGLNLDDMHYWLWITKYKSCSSVSCVKHWTTQTIAIIFILDKFYDLGRVND